MLSAGAPAGCAPAHRRAGQPVGGIDKNAFTRRPQPGSILVAEATSGLSQCPTRTARIIARGNGWQPRARTARQLHGPSPSGSCQRSMQQNLWVVTPAERIILRRLVDLLHSPTGSRDDVDQEAGTRPAPVRYTTFHTRLSLRGVAPIHVPVSGWGVVRGPPAALHARFEVRGESLHTLAS
jgi:hypothetical protein